MLAGKSPIKTLPKAQRTRGLSSSYESNLKCHIKSSNRNLEISDGVSETVSDNGSQCRQLNQFFSNIENLFTIQILPELHLQNLDQTLCSKSKQKFCFMTKPQLQNLQQTVADTILIINISNSKNLNKF